MIVIKQYFKHQNLTDSTKINQCAKYYSQGQCTTLLVQKENVYGLLNEIVGNENPLLADQGTIRQLFGKTTLENSCYFTKIKHHFNRL